MRFNPPSLKRKPKLPREVEGRGGYRYRQYANGQIEVLATPSLRHPGESIKLSPTKWLEIPGKAWKAVTAEIGEYKTGAIEITVPGTYVTSVLPGVVAVAGAALGYNYGSKGMSREMSAVIGGVGGFLLGRWLRPGAREGSGEVGFLGLGKKDKAHQQEKRAFELKEMARAEKKAAAEAEIEELERATRLAVAKKAAADAGVKAPIKAAGLVMIGNVYDDVRPRIWAYNDCTDSQDCED